MEHTPAADEAPRLAFPKAPVLITVLAVLTPCTASAESRYEAQSKSLDRISACIEKPGAPSWAGMYSMPHDEHGKEMQLSLCTDGFDTGSMHPNPNKGWDPSFGSVQQLAKDRFLLRSIDRSRERYLRLVRWDRCTYAVYEDEMLGFINFANGSWDLSGDIPSKCIETKEERRKGLRGAPELPPQWRGFLLKDEVVATVTSVTAYRPFEHDRSYFIKISAGKKAGLRPGFGISLFCGDDVEDEHFILEWAGENESEAQLVQYNYSEPFEEQCVPKVGQKASSRMPDNVGKKKTRNPSIP